jgi:NAD+ kinase
MKIAVLTKPNMPAQNTERIVAALNDNGSFQVAQFERASDITPDCDRILVFGGDGTVLEAVKKSADYVIPILGVNVGNLGFLSEFEQTAASSTIIRTLKSGKIFDRMLMRAGVGDKTWISLNDIVLKSKSTRPVHLDLCIDGQYVDSYHSDGIIVSTPTGSTAYSLSAGGPVLYPSVDAIVINPICPHTLHSRPLVINSESKIEISLCKNGAADIIVDGNPAGALDDGDCKITVEKADKSAKFVTQGNNNFYKKLLDKMNIWGTTLRQ